MTDKPHFDRMAVVREGDWDLETSDVDRIFAAPTQFAGLLYERMGETAGQGVQHGKLDIRIKLPQHAVMAPGAAIVTGIDPAELQQNGIGRHEAAWRIKDWFQRGRTAADGTKRITVGEGDAAYRSSTKGYISGHNSHNADRAWINQFFYQELSPNWAVSNTQGVIAGDTLPAARAAAIFAPETFSVPTDPKSGRKSFRLGDLCTANGFPIRDGKPFDAEAAHDALYDIEATGALRRHLSETAPEVMARMEENAIPDMLIRFLRGTEQGLQNPRPVVALGRAVKGELGAGMYTLVETDARYGNQKKAVLFNLAYDPAEYEHLSVDQIADLMRTQDPYADPKEAVDTEKGPVFERVALNKSPMVMPRELGERIGAQGTLSPADLDARKRRIEDNLDFQHKVMQAAAKLNRSFPVHPDQQPEEDIYQGMGPTEDEALKASRKRDRDRLKLFEPQDYEFGQVEKMSEDERRIAIDRLWRDRAASIGRFEDPTGRYDMLALLKVGRERPELLTPQQAKVHEAFVAYRINAPEDSRWMSAPRALKELDVIEKGPKAFPDFAKHDEMKREMFQRLHDEVKADPAKKAMIGTLRKHYKAQQKAHPLTKTKLKLLGYDAEERAKMTAKKPADQKPKRRRSRSAAMA